MFAAETKAVHKPATTTSSPKASEVWGSCAEPLEPFLKAVSVELARQVREFDPAIRPFAEYALTAQGKQLRPILVALSGGAAGKVGDEHVKVAVIIEMIHLATLVHDDILDEAVLRRGRSTLASQYGNDIAVLLGDCLFAQALNLASGFPTTEVCRAVSAATNTVCTGEILQTCHRRAFQTSRAEYFKVLEMKTAELFALSCDLGGWLGGGADAEREALKAYGIALGTAYQIYDDCVDLFGKESAAGKSLGTDLAKGKLTLPVLILWENATEREREELGGYVRNWSPETLPRVRELLARYGARAESLSIIHQYLDDARKALQKLPATDSRSGLVGLTEYLTQLTHAVCA